MANILMIVAPKEFRDEELFEPKKVFEDNGYTVKIASKKVEEAKGKLGATISVDFDIDEVLSQDYKAIIFVGGPGTVEYFDDEIAHSIARESIEQGIVIGAICIAPSILANAGVLEGKKATCYESEADNLKSKGAKYTGEDVTVDGKIVTANGPSAATKFVNTIIKLIE